MIEKAFSYRKAHHHSNRKDYLRSIATQEKNEKMISL